MLLRDLGGLMLSIGEAAAVLGIHVSTMRRWEKQGVCTPVQRTHGGHLRYRMSDLISAGETNPYDQRKVIAYARVSSRDQADDLERQALRLTSHCVDQDLPFEVVKDLGSGINFKKRGLRYLLREIIRGSVSKIVMTHKDRLLRFGSELVFELCRIYNTEIVLLEANPELTDEQQMAEDVLEIMTVFSSRLYGRRSSRKKKKRKEMPLEGVEEVA